MDDRFVFLYDWQAERFLVGMGLTRFYMAPRDSRSIIVEFEDSDANCSAVRIRCHSDYAVEIVRDRLCESFLHHPGVLDLRGIELHPSDVEEL